ncbi:hypothetical protein NEAUS03_1380 [Nematocida ausubeli]|nr:hypothetical protein NEAUS03_1380 [Nematocida ausubeli]
MPGLSRDHMDLNNPLRFDLDTRGLMTDSIGDNIKKNIDKMGKKIKDKTDRIDKKIKEEANKAKHVLPLPQNVKKDDIEIEERVGETENATLSIRVSAKDSSGKSSALNSFENVEKTITIANNKRVGEAKIENNTLVIYMEDECPQNRSISVE